MNVDESMLDVYIYETQQLLESLENTLLSGENEKKLNADQINEIFRIMHTIKGASAMMEFENMAKLAHTLEDMFALIRENDGASYNWQAIFDAVFGAISFCNAELAKLVEKAPMDGDAGQIISKLKKLVGRLKKGETEPVTQAPLTPPENNAENTVPAQKSEDAYYKVKVFFEDNSRWKTSRPSASYKASKISSAYAHIPEDLNSDEAAEEIITNGFCVFLQTGENPDRIKEILDQTLF